MMPGGGHGSEGQNPFARFVVGAATALVMSAIMITMYSLVPQHEARLRPDGPRNPAVRDGLWEQKDFFGLIDTQWSMRDGRAQGLALQYHSNGSLFREMSYRDGRLDGPVWEFHEKNPYRVPPVRGRLAAPAERIRSAGKLRRVVSYRDGVLHGPYQRYDKSGVLREEGSYAEGTKRDVLRYGKDGKPRPPRFWEKSSSRGEGLFGGGSFFKKKRGEEDPWTRGR